MSRLDPTSSVRYRDWEGLGFKFVWALSTREFSKRAKELGLSREEIKAFKESGEKDEDYISVQCVKV